MNDKDQLLDIIIVGAGPGGISMTAEAVAAGIVPAKILLLEKSNTHSWAIRSLYPDEKPVKLNYKGFNAECVGVLKIGDTTKEETIELLDKTMDDTGVNVLYNTEVHKIEAKGNRENPFFEVKTDSSTYLSKLVVVGIGIFGRPRTPDYRIPIKLSRRVHHDVIKLKEGGEKILVVGGGDSAAEYAQYLKQKDHDVTLSYRRDSFFRMQQQNEELLLELENEEKIQILWGSNIDSIETSADKRPVVKFAEEKYPPVEYDHLLFALGGTTPEQFLNSAGIELVDGRPFTEGGESNIPGLFVTGDLTAGKKGGSIAMAFNTSHFVMQRICNNAYLPCRDKSEKTRKLPVIHNKSRYFGPKRLENGQNVGNTVLQIHGRGKVKLKELIGPKGALIFFYHGNWCQTCDLFFIDLVRRQGELEKVLPVIAISMDNHDDAHDMVHRHGVWFPVAFAADKETTMAFGVYINEEKSCFEPAFYIIDGDCRIQHLSITSTGGLKPNLNDLIIKKKQFDGLL